MNPALGKPTVLRSLTGFVLTGLAISAAAGLSLVASIWILEASVDGWKPDEILGGALLVAALAVPMVFVVQFLIALPVLILIRGTGLLASSAATGALGCILGFFTSGILNGLLMGFAWPETFHLACVGAFAGATGGLVWWQLVERYFAWS